LLPTLPVAPYISEFILAIVVMVLNGTSKSYPWRNTSVEASSGQPRICLGAVTGHRPIRDSGANVQRFSDMAYTKKGLFSDSPVHIQYKSIFSPLGLAQQPVPVRIFGRVKPRIMQHPPQCFRLVGTKASLPVFLH